MAQTVVQLKTRREAAPGRYDLYAHIHKGLRSFMMHTLEALGRTDVLDEFETRETLEMLRALLGLCRTHLEKENAFVHTALEARRPGACAKLALEHAHHERSIAALEDAARSLEQVAGEARAAAALGLYRALALFVAENFEHMHVEETDINALLWEAYDDAELVAVERSIVASIPPAEAMVVARWMLPALDAAERAAKLAVMQASAPREAFAGVLAMLKKNLSERDWYKLGAALGPTAPAA